MEEPKFTLRDGVIILMSGVPGKIVGLWFSISGEPQYNVRYADQNDLIAEHWFIGDDLKLIKPPDKGVS